MQSSHDIHNRGVSAQKITLGDKIWQFIRFTVVTGMIFAISFFAINFTAYKQILVSAINPEAQAQVEKALEVVTGSEKKED